MLDRCSILRFRKRFATVLPLYPLERRLFLSHWRRLSNWLGSKKKILNPFCRWLRILVMNALVFDVIQLFFSRPGVIAVSQSITSFVVPLVNFGLKAQSFLPLIQSHHKWFAVGDNCHWRYWLDLLIASTHLLTLIVTLPMPYMLRERNKTHNPVFNHPSASQNEMQKNT